MKGRYWNFGSNIARLIEAVVQRLLMKKNIRCNRKLSNSFSNCDDSHHVTAAFGLVQSPEFWKILRNFEIIFTKNYL